MPGIEMAVTGVAGRGPVGSFPKHTYGLSKISLSLPLCVGGWGWGIVN